MRWIALSQHMDFDIDIINVAFIPGRFKLSEMRARILKEVQDMGEVVLVVIDTSAAFFEGDEPNNNAQQGAHAPASANADQSARWPMRAGQLPSGQERHGR
jgi:hypothetical protein